jgi:predicted DNA-binding protein with PD1-like motif
VKKAILLAALSTGFLLAQQSRTQEAHPSGAAEDSRPNNPNVPDVFAISGHFERIVVLRFKFQTDLLAGLEKMVKEQKIQNAVILSGMGSVRNYHIHAVTNRDFPTIDTFTRDPTAPADLIGMSGFVIDGRIHAHITLANAEHAFGGHLEPGTSVFTFANVTLGVFEKGVDLSKVDDKTYR